MARARRSAGIVVLLVLIGALVGGWILWKKINAPVTAFEDESRILFIRSGSDLGQVTEELLAIQAISDARSFKWISEQKGYDRRIRPGRYRVEKGMSQNDLVNRLRAGEQEPVRVTFSNIKRTTELAGILGRTLEPDSLAFIKVFNDQAVQQEMGMSTATFISLFIPNTYELWWTTTPEKFVARMRKEYDAFWNADRQERAAQLRLSRAEVATLASVVQAETVKISDAGTIAGVYLNRLRIKMPLQADPTLKFALGLDSISRVLDRDKDVVSLYNTYTNRGLPPGPINMPEPRFMDAVLGAEKHDFLYFCARADLSGHSDFARTYEQHQVNARKYQRALNDRKIFR